MNKPNYDEALAALKAGDLESASLLIHDFSSGDNSSADALVLKWLIQTRIRLKSNLEIEEHLPPIAPGDPYLRADIYFVMGLIHFHHSRWEEGSLCFSQSASHFAVAGSSHRRLFSMYNCHIGLVNAGHSQRKLGASLDLLEREARIAKDNQILALAFRQRSYDFFSANRYEAASRYAKRALRYFSLSKASKSDRHLTLLLDALIESKRQRNHASKASFEEVFGELDPRVEYSQAVVAHLLWPNDFARPRINDFPVSDFFFESQLQSFPTSPQKVQKISKSVISVARTLRPSGMESKVLKLLCRAPQTKAQLVASLYDAAGDKQLVDNRLHRLISRLNQRNPGMISLKNGRYSL